MSCHWHWRSLISLTMAARVLAFAGTLAAAWAQAPVACEANAPSVYSLNLTAIDGTPLPLWNWTGRVALMLNVASF